MQTRQPQNLNKAEDKVEIYINELRERLEGIEGENSALQKEINTQDTTNTSLIEGKLKAIDLLAEKKNKFNILKKDLEFKKSYLDSLLRCKKPKIEAEQYTYLQSLESKISKIAKVTDELNSIVNVHNNKLGESLLPSLMPLSSNIITLFKGIS